MTTPTAGRLMELFVFFVLFSILIYSQYSGRAIDSNAAEGWPSREIIRIHGFPTDLKSFDLKKKAPRVLEYYSSIRE